VAIHRRDDDGKGMVRMDSVSETEIPSPSISELLEGRPSSSGPLLRSSRELPSRIVSSRVNLRTRVRELFRARELFIFLVRKELKVKYKASFLGLLWSMLNPAVVLIVYYVVFKYFLQSTVPFFALYLFSGLIVWNLFLTALMGSSSVIVANAGIVKKVAFPREILPLSQVGTAVVFFFFQAIVLMLFLVGFQYAPDWRYLPLLAFALVDLIIFASALAIFISAANVYMRDIEHLIVVLLNAWFWGVPIIYSFNKVYHHVWIRWFYLLDPIVPIILTFQRAIYGKVTYQTFAKNSVGKLVPTSTVTELATYPYHFYIVLLGLVLAASLLLLLGAMIVFGRIEGNFAEEL